MNRSLTFLTTSALCSLLLIGCDTAKTRETGRQVMAEQVNPRVQGNARDNLEAMEKNGITVTPYTQLRTMNEAALSVREPNGTQAAGPVKFAIDVSNFRLGVNPSAAPTPGIVQSPLGQTITTIIDNETATEHDKTSFTENLTDGNHVVLSFLTRNTRESLKHRLGYDLRTVSVGKAGASSFNVKGPHLFYNLPRGTYVGDEADRILLDFFLVNTTLDEEGTQVRLTVNKTPFILTRWAAYTLEGLPMGPNTVKLELINAEGNLIPGPFNSVTKTITLRPGA